MGELAILIPLLGVSIPILAIWTKHRKEVMQMQIEATAVTSAEKAAQYASRTQELEDRVRVLERIVTDRGYDIATQIEALRDQRQTDDRNMDMRMNAGLDASKKEPA